MNLLHKQVIRSSILGTLVLFCLLFIPAGTLNYWQGWLYFAVFMIASSIYSIYLAKNDPELLRRRTEAGISYEKEPAQKVIIFLLSATSMILMILAPLDVRWGWSYVPWYIVLLGDILVLISFYIFYLVAKVNTYAAANIRVEKGQKVITTGLYGYVRHPMYFGALFLLFGTPIALGSWWTLLLMPIFISLLIVRILNEEKLLAQNLPGYSAYQKKVTTRLIPFVW
ncbi:Putative protein-S-isoprenylcysteine methyltransferase [Legionella wadsworthii]|uniref:S-isoprenylcysteine methyltransferase n=1 Tax=Legionella wadsworthii TaxID=28088 RepID=A0A378LQV6_9GAMM|nr:isoprenylcysteine carboxylmethyltransferase family protein [Legionella wadsworthii]STY29097.1 Putative protein-S-isoprenylcysteine methyltransferase [Legionella wadsworthii]